MADTNSIYPVLHEVMGQGDIDFESDEFRVALLDETASFDNSDTQFSDVDSAEISGDGYDANGAELEDTDWVRDADTITYTSADVTWQTNDELVADNAVIYHVPTETLVTFSDFSETKTAIGNQQDAATFRLDWESDDIVFEIETNATSD